MKWRWPFKAKTEQLVSPAGIDVATCDTCGGVFKSSHMQTVEDSAVYFGKCEHRYCQQHRKPYARSFTWGSLVTHYYKEIEVDVHGEPIPPFVKVTPEPAKERSA